MFYKEYHCMEDPIQMSLLNLWTPTKVTNF
jgi:hypothetical protein